MYRREILCFLIPTKVFSFLFESFVSKTAKFRVCKLQILGVDVKTQPMHSEVLFCAFWYQNKPPQIFLPNSKNSRPYPHFFEKKLKSGLSMAYLYSF